MARRPLRALTRTATAALVVTVLAGCAANASDAGAKPPVVVGPPPTPAPSAPSVWAAEATAEAADAVALDVTRAWLSYDTRIDGRPTDTARRLALRWLAPSLRRQVESFAGAAQPGASWTSWTGRHAHATVAVRLGSDDRPPDTADLALRQVLATITLRGDRGWVEVRDVTLFLQLTRSSSTWLVTDIRSFDGA